MAETVSMPKLGFDMREGTLVRWVKNEGEQINKGDVLAEIETDKATVEVESSAEGVVRRLLVGQGEVVPVGAPIAIVGGADEKIEEPAAPKAESKPAASAPAPAPLPSAPGPATGAPAAGPAKASPLARKMARDKRLDLSRIQGSGPGGRIVRRDVEAALAEGAQPSPGTDRPSPAAAAPLPSFAPVSYADETVGLSKLRQAIGRRMAESKASVPHFYVTHEYKMDALMALRSQINEYLPEDQKLSVNDFIVKAAALTLRQFPNLNASLDGDKVVRHGAVNVGVAVTVEGGLLTVVSRDTDQKRLRQVSSEVKAMVARARDG
jgi:pyruvate dehydrogenase E2 component (dihydrolipoamide acetyltransferase)